MAVSPVVLNGTIQQTNGVLQNQTRETQKGALDQGNIEAKEVRQEYQKARQVVKSEDSRFQEERFDAKEKGKGSYQGDGGKKRKKQPEAQAIRKPVHGFDTKA